MVCEVLRRDREVRRRGSHGEDRMRWTTERAVGDEREWCMSVRW
jgi:hypothetical protein